ncbi:MAG: Fur family transcriptional regulator [Aggregatilineales bacterium]
MSVPDPDTWLDAVRASGCRLTGVQETLARIFAYADSPLSAEQVWDYVRQTRPGTGRATVYRMVDKLESLGLLRRVHGYRGCSHLIPALPEPTILFICRLCGRVDYFDGRLLNWLVQQAEDSSGHCITESRLQLSGTCAVCQHTESSSVRGQEGDQA